VFNRGGGEVKLYKNDVSVAVRTVRSSAAGQHTKLSADSMPIPAKYQNGS